MELPYRPQLAMRPDVLGREPLAADAIPTKGSALRCTLLSLQQQTQARHVRLERGHSMPAVSVCRAVEVTANELCAVSSEVLELNVSNL